MTEALAMTASVFGILLVILLMGVVIAWTLDMINRRRGWATRLIAERDAEIERLKAQIPRKAKVISIDCGLSGADPEFINRALMGDDHPPKGAA